jgi:hypothetical protein
MTGAAVAELNSAMFDGSAIAGAAGHVQTGAGCGWVNLANRTSGVAWLAGGGVGWNGVGRDQSYGPKGMGFVNRLMLVGWVPRER